MSPALQVKILRILQWGEFSPLGSDQIKQCDVRIVAASKKSLRELVEEGKFRDDLYYRLNLIRIEMPPIRDRKEDILLLANTFLEHASKDLPKDVPCLSPSVERNLMTYDYPGNVRELENVIKRAVILCKGKTIELEHLPPEMYLFHPQNTKGERGQFLSFKEEKKRAVENFERHYIESILDTCGGVIIKAAKRAGMHEKNLRMKINKYGIRVTKLKKNK